MGFWSYPICSQPSYRTCRLFFLLFIKMMSLIHPSWHIMLLIMGLLSKNMPSHYDRWGIGIQDSTGIYIFLCQTFISHSRSFNMCSSGLSTYIGSQNWLTKSGTFGFDLIFGRSTCLDEGNCPLIGRTAFRPWPGLLGGWYRPEKGLGSTDRALGGLDPLMKIMIGKIIWTYECNLYWVRVYVCVCVVCLCVCRVWWGRGQLRCRER